MKFSKDKTIIKNVFGVEIIEYCANKKNLPIDCAIAKFRNSEYPWKINRNFYEMFYILDGECAVNFRDKVIHLKKEDAFLIPIDIEHKIQAKFADILISCTPQFDAKNIEFIS